MRFGLGAWAVAVLLAWAGVARAGEADVVDVEVHCDETRQCRFDVTVRHADESWDHYADRWEVLAPDGTLLGTRVFRHPHVAEQPFTTSLPWVRIPEGVEEVRIRARDKKHGYSRERLVPIPGAPTR